MGFPAWSRAVSAQGSVKATAGAVNVPVVLGGQTVAPGRRGGGRRRRRDGGAARRRRRGRSPRRRPAIDKEAASRAAFQQGELGLDRYGLRDRLPDLGIEYVAYEEYAEGGRR